MSLGDRWWLTCNGEVFNHLELRGQLGDRDWRGGSNTETLHALAAWDEAIPRCNGLFAFAALDLTPSAAAAGPRPVRRQAAVRGPARRSAVVRLRGRGAARHAGLPRAARPDVLGHAVAYGWAEGSETPFAGVDRVAPGTLLESGLDDVAVRERRWYDPAAAVDSEQAAKLARAARERWPRVWSRSCARRCACGA